MTKEFFTANRRRFAAEMKDNSAAVFFSGEFLRDTADQFMYPFSVERNFYYMTGIGRENMRLIIAKTNGVVSETLYIPLIDEMYERWNALFMREDEAREISGIKNVAYAPSFESDFAKKMFGGGVMQNVYLFSHIAELDEPDTPSRRFAQAVRRQYPAVNILNPIDILSAQRFVKHPEEHAEIQNAVNLTGEALSHVLGILKPGLFEYEIASHYQHILTMKNSRPRFRSVIAAGGNALILHYNAYGSRLKDGDLLLMDLGAFSGWYVSDVTRTYPVNGKYSPRQRELYDIVLGCNDYVISELNAGSTDKEANELCKKYFGKALKAINMIKDEADAVKYIWHSIGHPIGLDLHDFSVLPEKILRENAVYTIEPALYIPEEGIGIRVEDDIIIQKNGCLNMSNHILKQANDIENFMDR